MKKIIMAILMAGIVAMAVGVPIAFGDAATEARVAGIPPVVETITISPDDDADTPGVQINPNPVSGGDKTVTITALVYCENGVDGVDTVTATIDPDIDGVAEPVTMTMQDGDPGPHKKNYQGTFELPPYQAAGLYTVTVTATHKKAGVASGSGVANFTVTGLKDIITTNGGGDFIRYKYEIMVRVFYAGNETEEKEVPKKGAVENGGSPEGEAKKGTCESAFALIVVILVILVLFFIIVRKRRKK